MNHTMLAVSMGSGEILIILLSLIGLAVAAAFVIDLPDLGGSARLQASEVEVHTLVSFDGL